MAKVNPEEISYLFPGGEVPNPRFNRDEADYVVRSEGEFASAVEAHSEGDQIHVDPNARIELENREYQIRGNLISDGATLVQDTEDAWGWGTWQINFISNDSQVCVGINLRGPHADGTIVDDDYTNGTGDYRERHILVGLMSESPRTTVYECDVSGFTYGNIMFRGKKCRAINNRSYNAAFDHLGYGIACMTDDGSWADRTVVIGNYTDNCRHHVEHGGRDNCTEIAYHTCGPNAPFSHVLDVHRPGSKKTVWHHITVQGNENNAEGGVNEVFNFRGTPIYYHEVYAVHFDYTGDVPPEPPETSNDGNGSAIMQTNQGLEDRYTWAENRGGDLELDEYKDKDKPYSTEDTDGVKGFDKVHWINRDNAFGPGGRAHVGSGDDSAPEPLWHRVKIGGDDNEGHYRIEADDVRRGAMANTGDKAMQQAATGYVKGGQDTYYIRGKLKMSADDTLDVSVMENGYTSDLIPDTDGALPVENDDSDDESSGGDNSTGINPLTIMNEQYEALADLSNQNVLDVDNGDDITGLLQEASNATDTVTVVPAGEYQTDYLSLEMNDCAIIGEPGETVVLEPNSSRDNAGEYFITINGDTWAFSNFVFDFSQDGYGGRLQAEGETFVVSHIRNRGQYPPESKGFSTDVNSGETGLISQCKISGTEEDGTDTNGILVSSSHEGTVFLRDCEMGRFTNNAVYGSDPGRDYGNDGRVVVEGGKFTNSNVANLRIGSTDSVAREATIVVDERVKTSEGNQSGENSRGIRVRDRHGCLVEDCDVTYREGGSPGNAAIAIHDEAGRATVRNCRVKTAGQLPHLRVEESGMSGDVGVLVEGCHFSGDVDGDDAFDLGRDDLEIRDCVADFENDVDGVEYAPDQVEEPSTEPRDPVSTAPVEEPETPDRPEPEQPDETDPTVPVEPPEVPDDPEGPSEDETRIYVEGDGSTTEQLSYTIEVTGNARLGGLSGNSDNIVFNDGNATIKGQVPGDSDDDFFVTGEIVNIESDPALTIEVGGEEYVQTSRVYLFGNQWVPEDERGDPAGWEAYKVETDAPAQEDRKADDNDEIINPDSQAAIHGVLALNGGDAFIIEGSVTNIIAPPEINVWIDGNDYTGSRELRRPDGISVPGESPETPTPPAPDEPEPPEQPDEGDSEAPDSGDGGDQPEQPEPPEESPGEPEQPDETPDEGGKSEPEVPEPPKDAPDLPDVPDEIPQGDPSELTRAELVAGFVTMLNTLDYFNQE